MLIAYVDESRTAEKVPVVGVGGGVGTGLQWGRLLKAWRQALDTEGVDIFHTSEFETPEGRIATVYEAWDSPRLKAFQNELLNAIKNNQVEVSMVATVAVSEFYAAATSERVRRFGDEYFFCAFMLVRQIAIWSGDMYGPDQRVNYYFEKGGPHENRFKKSYEMVADDEEAKRHFKFWLTPEFAPKDAEPALQVADKLVYEAAKHASHFLDDDPPEEHSMIIPETGQRVWKTRYPSEELILGGLDIHVRGYTAADVDEFFRTLEED